MRRPRDLVLDLSQAKCLSIRLPDLDAVAPPPRPSGRASRSGRLVVEFAVEGRPIPWSAPHVPRRGRAHKAKPLAAWQRTVHRAAVQAMRGRSMARGLVGLEMTFFLRPRSGSAPDLVNLAKSCEDALQRACFPNDRKVVRHRNSREVANHDGVLIRVLALEGKP